MIPIATSDERCQPATNAPLDGSNEPNAAKHRPTGATNELARLSSVPAMSLLQWQWLSDLCVVEAVLLVALRKGCVLLSPGNWRGEPLTNELMKAVRYILAEMLAAHDGYSGDDITSYYSDADTIIERLADRGIGFQDAPLN